MSSQSEPYDGGPIPGPPKSPMPDYPWAQYRGDEAPITPVQRIGLFVNGLLTEPMIWIREKIIEPNKGPKYYWYHKKFKKVLPIDECYVDDKVCIYEANLEYKRGFMVDKQTMRLLQWRLENCRYWYSTAYKQHRNHEECKDLQDTFDRESVNFHIKYGDMDHNMSVMEAYNKQKHRMIMERRIALKKKAAQESGLSESGQQQ